MRFFPWIQTRGIFRCVEVVIYTSYCGLQVSQLYKVVYKPVQVADVCARLFKHEKQAMHDDKESLASKILFCSLLGLCLPIKGKQAITKANTRYQKVSFLLVVYKNGCIVILFKFSFITFLILYIYMPQSKMEQPS